MPIILPNPPVFYELAGALTFVWEAATARYRSKATGRFVAESTIRTDMERYNERAVADAIGDITNRLLDGRIDLATWQQRMAAEIKDAHIINLQVGRGGKAVTEFSDYGRAGARLRFQYRKLDDFAKEIQLGDLTEAQIRNRARMYALAPRTAYYDGLTAAKYAAGYIRERRVLNNAEHCQSCVTYAALGWQPIGSLPEPGVDSECLTSCKCEKQYEKEDGTIE